MWSIIVALSFGILVGSVLKLNEKQKKLNSKLQHAGVVGLLLFMGISIGMNKELVTQIKMIGIKSLVFGLSTSIFSIIIVYVISTFLFNKLKDDVYDN